jgi:hypothetical protein
MEELHQIEDIESEEGQKRLSELKTQLQGLNGEDGESQYFTEMPWWGYEQSSSIKKEVMSLAKEKDLLT